MSDRSRKTVGNRRVWRPPPLSVCQSALGAPIRRPKALKAACACCNFEPKRAPQPGDWLADGQPGEGERGGQTYKQFLNGTKHMRFPKRTARTIYLCHIDANESPQGRNEGMMSVLSEFVSIYFGVPCEIMEPFSGAERRKLRSRESPLLQLQTGPIVSILAHRLKASTDAFAVVGVTMVDLYPGKDWNFVFGSAAPHKGVGVFSFARYRPEFDMAWERAFSADGPRNVHDLYPLPLPASLDHSDAGLQQLLWRAITTLAHEIGHLFHLEHCVFFQCVMNGSNSLPESDSSPLHACPICLRKLHKAVGKTQRPFDILERYQQLGDFLAKKGLTSEAAWYRDAAERCQTEMSNQGGEDTFCSG